LRFVQHYRFVRFALPWLPSAFRFHRYRLVVPFSNVPGYYTRCGRVCDIQFCRLADAFWNCTGCARGRFILPLPPPLITTADAVLLFPCHDVTNLHSPFLVVAAVPLLQTCHSPRYYIHTHCTFTAPRCTHDCVGFAHTFWCILEHADYHPTHHYSRFATGFYAVTRTLGSGWLDAYPSGLDCCGSPLHHVSGC